MLATRNLTIRFGGHVAVNGVTCAFAPGTLTAIVGPNGAGKTTYFNLISGQLKATGGDVNTNKLIKTMEGMSFDTPKGKMTFRKEDHQALQSMYHFKIKVDPAFAWGVPELVREIKPEEMNVPIRNKR